MAKRKLSIIMTTKHNSTTKTNKLEASCLLKAILIIPYLKIELKIKLPNNNMRLAHRWNRIKWLKRTSLIKFGIKIAKIEIV